jgi:tripartite-type tricarboxylate transporter receptor subunit TctC
MRRLLALLALITCGLTAATAVRAQGSYPARPVKIICGFAAGSSLDIITRIYAQKLEEGLGQPFFVENRAGASGNLAAETVARAAPDGYTLLSDGITQAISMSLFKSISFDIVSDFEPIAFVGSTPNILVVNAALGVQSVPELIARAKAHPGELSYGTAGIGTAPHMSGELFNLMAGVKLMHVPYRGTNQAMIDLLGGRLSLMFSPGPTIVPHMTDTRLKLLGTTSAARSSLVPDLKPLGQTAGLEGFDTSLWYGAWAPKGTPKEIVKAINNVVVKATAMPAMKSQLAANGADPVIATPDEFGAYVRAEVEKWAKVVAFSGTKID